jgi:hypothetical protein
MAMTWTYQVLHVLKDEHLRTLGFKDAKDVPKQCASRLLHAELLAGLGEGLTWEACTQHIMIRYKHLTLSEGNDVTLGFDAPVLFIYGYSVRVNLGSKDALTPEGSECAMEPSNACEQVNESERH